MLRLREQGSGVTGQKLAISSRQIADLGWGILDFRLRIEEKAGTEARPTGYWLLQAIPWGFCADR